MVGAYAGDEFPPKQVRSGYKSEVAPPGRSNAIAAEAPFVYGFVLDQSGLAEGEVRTTARVRQPRRWCRARRLRNSNRNQRTWTPDGAIMTFPGRTREQRHPSWSIPETSLFVSYRQFLAAPLTPITCGAVESVRALLVVCLLPKAAMAESA